MRSDTDLSLYQFGKMMGLNTRRLAGIHEQPFKSASKCTCYLARDRQSLVESIQFAEQIFTQMANTFPVPTVSLDDVPYNGPMIAPGRNEIRAMGRYQWTEVGDVVVEKSEGATLLKTFTMERGVPDGTLPEEVHIFVRSEDGGMPPERQSEIKPLTRVVINGNVATITAPAELFLLPELDDAGDCVEVEEGSFLDYVSVYRLVVDSENYLALTCDGCGNETIEYGTLKRSGLFYYQIEAQCSCRVPSWVQWEYIAGVESSFRWVSPEIARILMALTIANFPFEMHICACDDQAEGLWKRYKEVPKEVIAHDPSGDSFILLYRPAELERLHGLLPAWGNLYAFQQIRKLYPSARGGRLEKAQR